jgi:hypothetical protein
MGYISRNVNKVLASSVEVLFQFLAVPEACFATQNVVKRKWNSDFRGSSKIVKEERSALQKESWG